MTYDECINYLYERLPMFQRCGPVAYKKDLSNTLKLLDHIGNPHRSIKTVHIAGTNGKGSSAHAIAAILQTAGYKTGLYTSPHLKDFTERIKINGSTVEKEFVISFVEQIQPAIEEIKPSFFEVTVVMAFEYFHKMHTDISVIETGLGGRLDSTNVLRPEVSLITRIGYDHMDLLGDTLAKIAGEKAGIIKKNIPVVIGAKQDGIFRVFEEKAKKENARLIEAQKLFRVVEDSIGELGRTIDVYLKGEKIFRTSLDIFADYFVENLRGVLTTILTLKERGWDIEWTDVALGLTKVMKLTGLKGRFQVIDRDPVTIADVSHNSDGVWALMKQVDTLGYNKLHIIYGTVKDKDVKSILDIFPSNALFYFTQSSVPRSMPVTELISLASRSGINGEGFQNVNEALRKARESAGKNDVILVTGSTFVVSEIDEL